MSCPLPRSWGGPGYLWFGLVIRAPSRLYIAIDAATAPIAAQRYDHSLAKADTSAGAGESAGTAAPCTS